MSRNLIRSIAIAAIFLFAGCKKDTVNTNSLPFKFSMVHQVDGSGLVFDSLMYTNDAGNVYSVSNLKYYLSHITLYRNKVVCYAFSNVTYMDAAIDSLSQFSLQPEKVLSTGIIDSVSFFIGVDSADNQSNYLPATINNINMGWPDVMGGGYHFVRLEGSCIDGASTSPFAMHIGTNGFQIATGFPCKINIVAGTVTGVSMKMNVNAWFRHPWVYNFFTDCVASMGDSTCMAKLVANGKFAISAN